MVNPNTIRNVIGIIGNVISFGLFLSPVPTFIRIIKNKSVEQFKHDPYIATILNCAMWVLYGLPFVHPHNLLVVTINGVGLAIELIYIAIFFCYANKQNKKRLGIALLVELVFFLAVFFITTKAIHHQNIRIIFIGALCVAFNVIMYFSPLTVMKQVIKTKSVKYMPFWLSVAGFLNGACWTAYACIRFDPWMVIPNGLGAISGVIQLILYAYYYKKPEVAGGPDDKQVELQEQA